MRISIRPHGRVSGEASVPGDKSIAHRWLILATCAEGMSELAHLPRSLDVLATARCLAALAPKGRPELERWSVSAPVSPEDDRFTANNPDRRGRGYRLQVRAGGWARLEGPSHPLDCANSATSLRLLAGAVSASTFETVLTGDESLRRRPMERVARPLREMGADVATREGRPPVIVRGGSLHGIRHRPDVPSAQVKGAILLAGLQAEGATTVEEPVPTRDHTERALAELGAPVSVVPEGVTVRAFQPPAFAAAVPGDVSSAAYLAAAAALTGGELTVSGVGVNPSRVAFVEVLRRMGVGIEVIAEGRELGEPVGTIRVDPGPGLRGTVVGRAQVPLLIDEIPLLAAVAAHADGETRFSGVDELRVKESDRLLGTVLGLRALGGDAEVQGDDLVVRGGGLAGGRADPTGDHRMAMSLAVAALRGRRPSVIDGVEAAEVSFPGFVPMLSSLGAAIEVEA